MRSVLSICGFSSQGILSSATNHLRHGSGSTVRNASRLSKFFGFFGALVFAAASPVFGAEDDSVKGWSFLAVDQTPTTAEFFAEGIAFALKGVDQSVIVDVNSSTGNPFPNTDRAFFVNQASSTEDVRISLRPFPGTIVTDGSLAFDFMIMEGNITAAIGITNQPWTADSSHTPSQRFFPFRLAPRQAIRINDQTGLHTLDSREIASGQTYLFRIVWSASNGLVEFRFFLGGSEVLDESANPFVVRVQQMDFESGDLVFNITSKFTGFLGSIRAKATDG